MRKLRLTLGLKHMKAEIEAQDCLPEAALSPSHLLIQHRRCQFEISGGEDQQIEPRVP